MRELDVVVLAVDVPAHGLEAGDVGTVVMVHGAAEAYEVEFATLAGETLVVLTLPAEAVGPFGTVRLHTCARRREDRVPLLAGVREAGRECG